MVVNFYSKPKDAPKIHSLYVYEDVETDAWLGLLEEIEKPDGSIGKFLNAHIKPHYSYKKLDVSQDISLQEFLTQDAVDIEV